MNSLTEMAKPRNLRIGVFVPEGAQLLDLSPIDLFGMLDPKYLAVCGLPAPLVALGVPTTIEYIALPKTGSHMELTASAFLRVSKTTKDSDVQPGQLDIILIPGPDPQATFDEEALDFLRAHAAWRGKDGSVVDFLSVCTGAFLLGASGVLDGKNASGPRALVSTLRKRFPEVKWFDDKRWVKDGNIWSSGTLYFSISRFGLVASLPKLCQ